MGQFRQANRGTQIRKKTEMLAERQKRSALGLFVGGKRFPLRSTDGSEEDGIRRLAGCERLWRQCAAYRIDGRSPDQLVVKFEGDGKFFRSRLEHTKALGHDFRPDSITSQYGDAEGFFWIHGGKV